jgi:hypothetical protein
MICFIFFGDEDVEKDEIARRASWALRMGNGHLSETQPQPPFDPAQRGVFIRRHLYPLVIVR